VSDLLAGRGAVVVGGSRGIGAAVTTLLTQHGAAVVVNGRDPEPAQEIVASIHANGGRAVAHAGSPILDISTGQFQELLDAHLGTVLATCLAAAAKTAEQGGGSIINTGRLRFLGDYGGTGYPAAKGRWTWLHRNTPPRSTFTWPATSHTTLRAKSSLPQAVSSGSFRAPRPLPSDTATTTTHRRGR
jgi:NAD(P)-dependent dehydrogenase (short-subunit alcohol dehydrogenase family)